MSTLDAGTAAASQEAAQSAISDTVLASTSATFATKLNLATTALRGGTYRITGSYTYQMDTTADWEAQAQIDNTTTIHSARKIAHPGEASTDRFPGGFEYVAAFAAGATPSIDLDLRRAAGSGSARIYESRLSIERIGP